MGIKFELNSYHRNISDKELLEDLARVASEFGQDFLTRKEYETKGKYGATTFIRKFGSWNNAVEKAGLNQNTQKTNTEEELFENIYNVWVRLGRQPNYSEIVKPLSIVSIATYEKRFGGWRNALEKFIEWVNSENKEVNFDVPTQVGLHRHKTKRDANYRLRFLVMHRDNFRCVFCGQHQTETVKLHVDHKTPYSKGGETELDNLQTLCEKCNYGKSDLDL